MDEEGPRILKVQDSISLAFENEWLYFDKDHEYYNDLCRAVAEKDWVGTRILFDIEAQRRMRKTFQMFKGEES